MHLAKNLLHNRQKPYISAFKTSVNSGTPLTITLPEQRERGDLVFGMITCFGGSTAPAIPTGFTNAGSGAPTASFAGMRGFYKLLNGTEANTTSSAAASSTTMAAIVFTIKGVHSIALAPNMSVTTGTSTTPDPPGGTADVGFSGALWIAFCELPSSTVTVSGRPTGFCDNYQLLQHNGVSIIAISKNAAIGSLDPSAFTISTSLAWRTQTATIHR